MLPFGAANAATASSGALPNGAPVTLAYPAPSQAPIDLWLAQVYAAGNPGPVWFTGNEPRPALAIALQTLRAAGERGLSPEDYAIDVLERQVEPLRSGRGEHKEVMGADRAITVTLLRFMSDLRYGRIPPQEVEPHFRAHPKAARFAAELRSDVVANRLAAAIDAVEPAFPLYGRLKGLLARYRLLAAEPAIVLPALAPAQTKIAVGDRYAGVRSLRAALVRLGDLDEDSAQPAGDTYTATLADAVRRFQARHGLQEDGILGRETLAALNVPPSARVVQIALSLERLRWLPDLPPGALVAINIPSFRLWAFADAAESGRATLSMPVVVGRAVRTETPVFIGEMRWVEFSPYWNVPPSILRKELLPRIARDPSYLDREEMEVVDAGADGTVYAGIDETTLGALSSGAARLRQRPGPRNALGGVKFVLPNSLDIYLHATPAEELFARPRRDFSHGCIRVREPEALAEFVLRGSPEWTPAAIRAAMTSGENRTVRLAAPVPVVIFYTTVIVDSAGSAQFLPDVYGHDARLREAIAVASRARR